MGVVRPLADGLLSSEMETELTNLRAGLDDGDGLGSGSPLCDPPFSCCLFVMLALVLLLLLLVRLYEAVFRGGCGLDVAFTEGDTLPCSSSKSPSSSTLAPPPLQASASSSPTSFCRLSVSTCLILRFSSRTRSISTKSSCICSALLRPWDVSLVDSVPEVSSLVGVSPGVWLVSASGSAALLELFTLLLFSLSTSSSSSLVHWRARLDKADQFFRLMDILDEKILKFPGGLRSRTRGRVVD